MKSLNHSFKNCKLSESVEPLSKNRHPNITQNEHVYAVCCRPEVAGEVISGENVNTTDGCGTLNFEAASLCSFRENQNHLFA